LSPLEAPDPAAPPAKLGDAQAAYSGDRDRSVRAIVITRSGDRDR